MPVISFYLVVLIPHILKKKSRYLTCPWHKKRLGSAALKVSNNDRADNSKNPIFIRVRKLTYNLLISSGGYWLWRSRVSAGSRPLCSIINLCSMYTSRESLATTCRQTYASVLDECNWSTLKGRKSYNQKQCHFT